MPEWHRGQRRRRTGSLEVPQLAVAANAKSSALTVPGTGEGRVETSDTTECLSKVTMGLLVQWGQGDRRLLGQLGCQCLGGSGSNLQRIKCWPDRDAEKGIPGRGHGAGKTGRKRTA